MRARVSLCVGYVPERREVLDKIKDYAESGLPLPTPQEGAEQEHEEDEEDGDDGEAEDEEDDEGEEEEEEEEEEKEEEEEEAAQRPKKKHQVAKSVAQTVR